jgi:6-phospho-3-hexuloisomerase
MRAEEALDRVQGELRASLAGVDPGALQAVVDLIRDGGVSGDGGAWFCTGQGRSGLVASMAAMRLVHLGLRAHVVGEATAPATVAGDVMLVLSASGTTPVTVHLARTAAAGGARVVAVTRDATSPLGELADVLVVVPPSGSGQFGGSLFEQTCLLLLDAAALAVAPGAEAQAGMRARHATLQ